MRYEYHDAKLASIFGFTDNIKADESRFSITENTIKLLWNRCEVPVQLQIDTLEITLQPHQILTTTYLQQVTYLSKDTPLTAFLFNRPFYCIKDHDTEVSCNGILFFGTQDIPIVTLAEDNKKRFDLLYQVFVEEFSTKDTIQGDMLQMLLKRLIILTTRLAKEQLIVKELNNDQIDIIRQFNYLVDMNYKEKRKVSDYAELLHKSPKTLSNLFATYNQKTPQQIILDRVVLEAKRLINFTDKQNQEIAYELGFNDPAHFSRFFKKMTQSSPTEYRNQLKITA